jgi:hypothetical protein
MKGSDFENINLRAREAFIIACIENAVQHEGLTHPRWQLLIDGMWDMLGRFYFSDMELYLMPRNYDFIELYANYDEYLTENSPEKALPPYSEIEFNELKEIFSDQTVASRLIEKLEFFSCTGVYGAHDPSEDYSVLDNCILLLSSRNIPSPPFENFVPFVWDPQDVPGGEYTRQDFFPVV